MKLTKITIILVTALLLVCGNLFAERNPDSPVLRTNIGVGFAYYGFSNEDKDDGETETLAKDWIGTFSADITFLPIENLLINASGDLSFNDEMVFKIESNYPLDTSYLGYNLEVIAGPRFRLQKSTNSNRSTGFLIPFAGMGIDYNEFYGNDYRNLETICAALESSYFTVGLISEIYKIKNNKKSSVSTGKVGFVFPTEPITSLTFENDGESYYDEAKFDDGLGLNASFKKTTYYGKFAMGWEIFGNALYYSKEETNLIQTNLGLRVNFGF